jgi:hypothetical protein
MEEIRKQYILHNPEVRTPTPSPRKRRSRKREEEELFLAEVEGDDDIVVSKSPASSQANTPYKEPVHVGILPV